MKISEALEILTELNEKYPDCKIAIYRNGKWDCRAPLFTAVACTTEAQKRLAPTNTANRRKAEISYESSVYQDLPF